MATSIAERWKILSGENHWEDLLDPLDTDLRQYIIHYGEMAQATYDSFNDNTYSKYAGSCRYTRKNLFSKVGLELANPYTYEVTKYFYATSSISVPGAFIMKPISREAWSKESNWMGYVAVSSKEMKVTLGRRDILVAWRGSVRPLEWTSDFESSLVPATEIVGEESKALVHQGFLSIYTSNDESSQFNKESVRDQVLDELKRLMELYQNEEISITIAGHSLGGALATLNAADIITRKINVTENKPCLVTAFIFGCPHVGDSNFRDLFDSLPNLCLLRVKNLPDIATVHPVIIGYVDVGIELEVDTRKSNFLRSPGDFETWHTMEAYLHGVAGIQGENSFQLEVKRDISLVNKRVDGLKDEYLIPPKWWCVQNMGMVQKEDGSWILEDHEKDDFLMNNLSNLPILE